ncbi:MAG: ABC transporter ATP-binding protein [Agathobacter sp.]|nr:ABC transporter ATP-binding protein [Agathobacter sp.]
MENKDKKYQNKFQLIIFFLQGAKRYFGLSVFFVCFLALFELINPKIIGYTVDFIIGDVKAVPVFLLDWIDSIGGREYVLSHLYIISLLVIGIAIIGAVFRYCFMLFNSMGAEALTKRMRNTLYSHIISLPYSWHDVNKTGDIIQRCTSDVEMIKKFISEQMTNLVRMIVSIVLAIYFMMKIHTTLTLIAIAFIPVVVVYSLMFHNKIGASFEKVDTEEGHLSSIAQENLTGVRVVRAFGREKYEKDRFEKKNEEYTNLWVKMMKILGSFWVTNDIISGVEVLSVLAFGAYFAVNGEISAGSYVAFASYNALLSFPVRQLGRVISEMSKAGISIDRIMYIMNSKEETDETTAGGFPGNGDIEFRNVSFSYDNEKVLDNLSLKIKKGQTIGILGGTGSGKSTMIQLLDGLYDLPKENGSIYINNVDIRQIRKKDLRDSIGMVLQEPYLFSRSIEDNIRIVDESLSHREVEEVVGIASLTSSIGKFKDGYDTYVGERGVTLSGGQKQRTAISQMLIRKTPIMIFDDSLSAVDAETDAKIREGLKNISDETTVIMISHRITTLMQSDNIFVIEDGKVIESGTHEELLKLNGNYKNIYNLQSSQGEEAVNEYK